MTYNVLSGTLSLYTTTTLRRSLEQVADLLYAQAKSVFSARYITAVLGWKSCSSILFLLLYVTDVLSSIKVLYHICMW